MALPLQYEQVGANHCKQPLVSSDYRELTFKLQKSCILWYSLESRGLDLWDNPNKNWRLWDLPTVHIILELVQEKNEKLRRLKFANPWVWLFFSVIYIKRKKIQEKREHEEAVFLAVLSWLLPCYILNFRLSSVLGDCIYYLNLNEYIFPSQE